MIDALLESLRQWNKDHDDRVKLQYAYFTLVIVLVVVAGLVGLLNVEMGRQILVFGSISGAVFILNAIAWALLQSFVLSKIGRSTRKSTTKK